MNKKIFTIFLILASFKAMAVTGLYPSAESIPALNILTPESFKSKMDEKIAGIKSSRVKNIYLWVRDSYETLYHQYRNINDFERDLLQKGDLSNSRFIKLMSLFERRFEKFNQFLALENPDVGLREFVELIDSYNYMQKNMSRIDKKIKAQISIIEEVKRESLHFSNCIDASLPEINEDDEESLELLDGELSRYYNVDQLLEGENGALSSHNFETIIELLKKLKKIDLAGLKNDIKDRNSHFEIPRDHYSLDLLTIFSFRYYNQENIEAYIDLLKVKEIKAKDLFPTEEEKVQDKSIERKRLINMNSLLKNFKEAYLDDDAYNPINLNGTDRLEILEAFNDLIGRIASVINGEGTIENNFSRNLNTSLIPKKSVLNIESTLKSLILKGSSGSQGETILEQFVAQFSPPQTIIKTLLNRSRSKHVK